MPNHSTIQNRGRVSQVWIFRPGRPRTQSRRTDHCSLTTVVVRPRTSTARFSISAGCPISRLWGHGRPRTLVGQLARKISHPVCRSFPSRSGQWKYEQRPEPRAIPDPCSLIPVPCPLPFEPKFPRGPFSLCSLLYRQHLDSV